TRYEVAILPWGATEAHNYHLPYATDTIQCDHIAAEAASRAWSAGAKTIVLPTVPFGVQTGQLDIPLCLNLNPSTQFAVLSDMVANVEAAGIPRLLVLNGHGGNDFKQMIRELQPRTEVFLCTLNWYQVLDPRQWFDEPGDHAGEMETSLMMHVAPNLVSPLSEAGDGREKSARVAAFREGWAWAPRQWTSVSSDTGVGNPARSTPVKGADFLDALADRIAGFLVELSASDPNNLYGD
ncbi:MAG: creatininase family protein, partial [Rhodothermales bacterium]|nr:creatininase family protein [Rhodothermales bacterium]